MNASEPIYAQVGAKIKKFRRAARLTSDQLGEKVGMHRTSIINIEAGRQRILLHSLCDFAEALGVKPRELL